MAPTPFPGRLSRPRTPRATILFPDIAGCPSPARTRPIRTREGRLDDLWLRADERRNEGINSFHSFSGPRPGGNRIDWILGRRIDRVTAAEIVTFARNGQFPSDHFPVVAWLELAAPTPQ